MGTINLSKYAPVIRDKETGQQIYDSIKQMKPESEVVTIDFSDIVTMATFCAKQIFGKLYLELNPEVFFSNIKIINANDDVKLIIRMGIQNAIETI